MRSLVYAFLAAAGVACAQRAPLESITVEGNQAIAAEKIIAASGLKTGAAVDKDDFEAARNRLIATGAFATVGYEYKPGADKMSYDAVLRVVEEMPLYPYKFEDLPAPDAVLRAAIAKAEPLFGDRIPASDIVVNRYKETIAKAIREAGGGEIKIASQFTENLDLVFRPPTAYPRIAEVRFQGNSALPSSLLLRTFSEVAVGIPYKEDAVRLRLDAAVRALYDARGRIRVSFPKVVSEPSPKVDGVIVTVTVDEGAVYKLGEVRITGVPDSEIAALNKTADWKKGDIANFDDINASVDRIDQRYRGTGYLKAATNSARTIHDDTHTVDLTVNVNRGPQYRFGKLEIVGLNLVTEPPIRDAWGKMEGKPYRPDYADSFLKELRDEGVFDNLGKTRSEAHINEETKIVDVTLYFTAAEPAPKKEQPGPFQ